MIKLTTRNGRANRRPRDRRAQILAAAVERFHQSGYHATSMEDIATAIGITAGSLYWHFRSKQELLEQAVLTGLDLVLSAPQDAEGLDAVLRALASCSLENRALSALWEKEAGSLSPECRREVQQRCGKAVAPVATAIREARPDLGSPDAELLGWAVLGMLASPSYHQIDLPRPRFDELLCELADSLCQARALSPVVPDTAAALNLGLPRASRREALLSAAVRLFAERGFQAVGMNDIGAAAGVSGPAVYNHFAAKTDLLTAAIHRASGALHFDLGQALAQSTSAHEALERTLRTFSVVALASGGYAGLLNAQPHLPPTEREWLHRSQVEYMAEWVGLLRTCRPDLDQAEAQITVHAVFTLIRVLSRIPPLKRRTDPVQTLVTLGLRTLGLRSRA
ncbi:helix-turn-helix domain-containing protein [Streptomyces sp. NPDC002215]|uniref:TetR/AcrR family transcriptional regulator n=1 Tax=Streptomyces sp. NPDC002215 TaxID=3154412 RepID=UPI0033284CEA